MIIIQFRLLISFDFCPIYNNLKLHAYPIRTLLKKNTDFSQKRFQKYQISLQSTGTAMNLNLYSLNKKLSRVFYIVLQLKFGKMVCVFFRQLQRGSSFCFWIACCLISYCSRLFYPEKGNTLNESQKNQHWYLHSGAEPVCLISCQVRLPFASQLVFFR